MVGLASIQRFLNTLAKYRIIDEIKDVDRPPNIIQLPGRFLGLVLPRIGTELADDSCLRHILLRKGRQDTLDIRPLLDDQRIERLAQGLDQVDSDGVTGIVAEGERLYRAIMKTDDPTEKGVGEPHAEDGSAEGSEAEESIASATGAAKKASKASRAVKDTVRKYLDVAGIKVDLEATEKRIRERPLFYLGLAAGTGFVIGGGLATKTGAALLGLVGRKAAVETATNFGRQVAAGYRRR